MGMSFCFLCAVENILQDNIILAFFQMKVTDLLYILISVVLLRCSKLLPIKRSKVRLLARGAVKELSVTLEIGKELPAFFVGNVFIQGIS